MLVEGDRRSDWVRLVALLNATAQRMPDWRRHTPFPVRVMAWRCWDGTVAMALRAKASPDVVLSPLPAVPFYIQATVVYDLLGDVPAEVEAWVTPRDHVKVRVSELVDMMEASIP